MRGRAARRAAARLTAAAPGRSAGDITTAMPKLRKRSSMPVAFGPGFREAGGGTTRPRAAAMTSRRAADSAGRSSLSTARWRWRGRVASPPPIPAMATSMASTRFNASRFFSIAAFQSIAASSRQGGIIAAIGRGGDKRRPIIFFRRANSKGWLGAGGKSLHVSFPP
jgi:hypothetical protein